MNENILFLIENGINDNVMGLLPHFKSRSPKYLDSKDTTDSVTIDYISANQSTVIPRTGEFVLEPKKSNIAYNNTRINLDSNIEGNWVAGGNVAVLDDEDRLPYQSSESATTLTWTEGEGNPQKVTRTFNCKKNTTYSYWIIVKPIKNSKFKDIDIVDVSGNDITNKTIIRLDQLNNRENKWTILEGQFNTSGGNGDYAEAEISFYSTSLSSLVFGGIQIEEDYRSSFIPSIEDQYTLSQHNSPIIEKFREETLLEYNYWFPNLDNLSSYTISATLSDYKRNGKLFHIENYEGNKVVDVSINNNIVNILINGQSLGNNDVENYPVTIDIVVNNSENSIYVCLNGKNKSQILYPFSESFKRKLVFSNRGFRKWKSFRIYDRALNLENTEIGSEAGGEIEKNLNEYPFSIKNIVSRKKSFLVKSIIPQDQGGLFLRNNPDVKVISDIKIYPASYRNLDLKLNDSVARNNPISTINIKKYESLHRYKSNNFVKIAVDNGSDFHLGRAFIFNFRDFVQEVTVLEINGNDLTIFPFNDSFSDLKIVQSTEESEDTPIIGSVNTIFQGFPEEGTQESPNHYDFQNETIFYIKITNIEDFKLGKAYIRSTGNLFRSEKGFKQIYIIDYLALSSGDEYLAIDLYDPSYNESIFKDTNNNIDAELIQFDFEAFNPTKTYINNGRDYRSFPLSRKQYIERKLNLYQNEDNKVFYVNGETGDTINVNSFLFQNHTNQFSNYEIGIVEVDDKDGVVNGYSTYKNNAYVNAIQDINRRTILFSDSENNSSFVLNGETYFLIYLVFGGSFEDWVNNNESQKPAIYFSSFKSILNSNHKFNISSSLGESDTFYINFTGVLDSNDGDLDQTVYNNLSLSMWVQSVNYDNQENFRNMELSDLSEYSKTDIANIENGFLSQWDNNYDWLSQFKSFKSTYIFDSASKVSLDTSIQRCYVRTSTNHVLNASLLVSDYNSVQQLQTFVIGFPSMLKNMGNMKDEAVQLILPNLENRNHFLNQNKVLPFNYKNKPDQLYSTLPNGNYINLNSRFSKISFPFSVRESQPIESIVPRINEYEYNIGYAVEGDIYVDNPSSYQTGICFVFDKNKNLFIGELTIESIHTNPPRLKCSRVLNSFQNKQLTQPINSTRIVYSPYRYYANILTNDEDISIIEKSSTFISLVNKGQKDKSVFVSIDLV